MEKAIKIAIDNGWKPFGSILHKNLVEQKWGVAEVYANYYNQPTFLLYPIFWQSLGKGLGWNLERNLCSWCGEYPACKFNCLYRNKLQGSIPRVAGWQYQWHRFIDHLAEGKDIESFFTDLVK